GFLKSEEIFRASGISQSRIRIEDISLLHIGVIMVVNAQETNGPFDRLEGRFTLENIDPDREVIGDKELFAPAKELGAVGPRARDRTGSREATGLDLQE